MAKKEKSYNKKTRFRMISTKKMFKKNTKETVGDRDTDLNRL